jgi:putative FmdB family regulatory protein
MPIYEYACKRCDHHLDALQKMSDEPLVDCPACGEPELKRLLSAPRFRLKGGGWYETDFKKDNQRNVLKSDSESADSGKKTDKKPDKKADTTSGSGSGSKPAAKSDS